MAKYTIRRWAPVILFIAFTFVLGYRGFRTYFDNLGATHNAGDVSYVTVQLFVLESGFVEGPINAELQVARFLAPIAAAYAVVQTLASVFSLQLRRVWLMLLGNHVIVCGLGRKGVRLVEQLRDDGRRVVIIEADEENHDLRYCRGLGAVVFIGYADDPRMLRKALVHRARSLISVAGEDGVNIECAVHAHKVNEMRARQSWYRVVSRIVDRCSGRMSRLARILRGKRMPSSFTDNSSLSAIIHVRDTDLQQVLKQHAIFAECDDSFELSFFNSYETAARVMLREPPLLTVSAGAAVASMHVLIVGFKRTGEALLSRLIRDWHVEYPDAMEKLSITVVDGDAEQQAEAFAMRYPALWQTAAMNFVTAHVRSDAFSSGEVVVEERPVTAAYVCLKDDSVSVYAALTMRRWLDDEVPIVVRMSNESGLATLFETKDKRGVVRGIHAVGLLEMACNLESVQSGDLEMLAQAIHQGYIQEQTALGRTPDENESLKPWRDLDPDLTHSNRDQARHVTEKLEMIGCEMHLKPSELIDVFEFTGDEIEKLAEMEHARWVEERRDSGWSLGEGKDVEKRTSPYLVPWDDDRLPDHVKDYDRNAVRRLPAILAKADYEIRMKPQTEEPNKQEP